MNSTKRMRFSVKFQRECIAFYAENGMSISKTATLLNISRKYLSKWLINKHKIINVKGNQSKQSTGGQGRKPLLPFEEELVDYINKQREQEEPLTTFHLVLYIKCNHEEYLNSYIVGKKEPLESLKRLLRRLIKRHNFSFRSPTQGLLHSTELNKEKFNFLRKYSSKFREYPPECIFNVDETVLIK